MLAQAPAVDRLRVLESCIAQAHDLIVITEAEPIDDPGPRIVYVNPAFERTTGYSADEVLGRSPRMLQGRMTDRATLDAIRAALSRWEPIRVELANETKAGAILWLEIQIAPVADARGWYTHWISVQRDITARKLAEERLRISEQRFHAVIEATPVPSALNDVDGRILYLNPAFVRTYGYTLDDIPTLDAWWRVAYPDESYRRRTQESWQSRLAEADRTGRSQQPVEVVVTCRDGTTRRAGVDVTVLAAPFDRMRLVVLNDVTEERRLDHDLARVISRDQRRHGLALHEDLGQRLAGAALLADSLSRRAGSLDAAALRDGLDRLGHVLRDCVIRNREIAEDVAPVALRAGDLPFALEQLAEASRRAGCAVTVHCVVGQAGDVPLVTREAAYHIAAEALMNARLHGGARAAVVRLDVDARQLRIEIEDDGRGFDGARPDAGAGLGSMRQRAQGAGGWLEITRAPEHGTIVTATLPCESSPLMPTR